MDKVGDGGRQMVQASPFPLGSDQIYKMATLLLSIKYLVLPALFLIYSSSSSHSCPNWVEMGVGSWFYHLKISA